MVITVDSVIGAGKTTLVKYLSKFLGTKAFLEKVHNNPILPLFYRGNALVEQGKWKHNPYAFQLQIYFLNMRYKYMVKALQNNNNCLDRSILADRLFMKLNYDLGNVSEPEWKLYSSLLHNMLWTFKYIKPKSNVDLLVYIKCPLSLELKHIKKRDRPYEQLSYDPNLLSYYKDLQHYYAKWYKGYHYSPKMMIHADKYDLSNKKSRLHILNMIKNKLIKIRK